MSQSIRDCKPFFENCKREVAATLILHLLWRSGVKYTFSIDLQMLHYLHLLFAKAKMKNSQISNSFSAAGQVTPEALSQAAEAGFRSVLNSRSLDESGVLPDKPQQSG